MQQSQNIQELILKLIHNTLTPAEIQQLTHQMQEIDDWSLDECLQTIWEEETFPVKRNKKNYQEIRAYLNTLRIPERKKQLALKVWRTVAAILIPALLLLSIHFYRQQHTLLQNLQTAYYHVHADKGENITVRLPDGTNVYLNALSHLSYPASFSRSERRVTLSGEAYFEVAPDPEKPFRVFTEDATIEVLGTTFNLYNHPQDQWIEVSLISGKVKVESTGVKKHTAILLPNQKVRYNRQTGDWDVTKTDLRFETAWRRGDLLFRSKNFTEIVSELERFYGVNIHLEGNIPNNTFNASYQEENILPVLENLQLHYKFSYRKSGKEIYIHFINL
ncbi:MAG: FecR domain-containing protein [Tannerellaceae bacterium]|nr:FecR domain-containing protein [Tannerellaceae bacterium]